MIDEDEDAERQLDLYLAIHTLRGMISKAHHGGGFNQNNMVGVDWIAGKRDVTRAVRHRGRTNHPSRSKKIHGSP
jgi:hypothetical protein